MKKKQRMHYYGVLATYNPYDDTWYAFHNDDLEAPWLIRNGFPLMKQEHMADSIGVMYAGMRTKEFEWLRKATSS